MSKRKKTYIKECGICTSTDTQTNVNKGDIDYICNNCGATGKGSHTGNWESWGSKKDPLQPPGLTYMPKKLYR